MLLNISTILPTNFDRASEALVDNFLVLTENFKDIIMNATDHIISAKANLGQSITS